ncbi:hypothetical protein IQ273_12270 [Nodosilinea sp. LEGE 07298]|uniref:hypothetical protein n=1 Tax=Nodosilinea sp. LEGE 07298 TaxID=2777970 RepID=UPI00187F6CAC|nr:hypothetical protein [Nodosilinea sp. LEGE 07298]MBE9110187.1 hypothetical protein [Nodosilinea sp. LEGE 07298]
MSQIKVLSVFATLAIASFASPIHAQEIPSQISTSVGFTLAPNGAVSSLTLSTALSDTYTFSSAISNSGGVYTEAFASNTPLEFTNAGMSAGINTGNVVSFAGTTGGPSTVTILAPGPTSVTVEPTMLMLPPDK